MLKLVVVIVFFSTSNHNMTDKQMNDNVVVIVFFSTSNHNLVLRGEHEDLLLLFFFLHQTTN